MLQVFSEREVSDTERLHKTGDLRKRFLSISPAGISLATKLPAHRAWRTEVETFGEQADPNNRLHL